MQGAWQLWMLNISCKRLDPSRVRVIDYQGLPRVLRSPQLEANFNQHKDKKISHYSGNPIITIICLQKTVKKKIDLKYMLYS